MRHPERASRMLAGPGRLGGKPREDENDPKGSSCVNFGLERGSLYLVYMGLWGVPTSNQPEVVVFWVGKVLCH